MHNCLRFVIAFFVVASTCDAQFAPCKASKPATIERSDGVGQLEVSFLEPTGEQVAHVFLPNGDAPTPGIVFSHSAIHGVRQREQVPAQIASNPHCYSKGGGSMSRVTVALPLRNGQRLTTVQIIRSGWSVTLP